MTDLDFTDEADAGTVELAGRAFRVSDKVGMMPLMRFARVAQKGAGAGDMEGLAAMYDFIQSVVAQDEWAAFQEHATDQRVDNDELLGFVRDAMSIIAARPTGPRSSSRGGSRTTTESSQDDSSSVDFWTPDTTPGESVVLSGPPIMRDPRILALVPLSDTPKLAGSLTV